jgi:hypothetical protein
MMTAAAAAHMTVAMAMTALDLDHGIAGVGGKCACRNTGHCGRCRRQGCERHGDKACFDKSFHWGLLLRVARQLAQVPRPCFCSRASRQHQRMYKTAHPFSKNPRLPPFPEYFGRNGTFAMNAD